MRHLGDAGRVRVFGWFPDDRSVPVHPGGCGYPAGELRQLVEAQVRRVCRRSGFDWESFLADGPELGIVEVVHRRVVQRGHGRGLAVRPADVSTDDVLTVVRDVIAAWSDQPELRPSEADFRQEQARRGEKGRDTQQLLALGREAQVMTLVASGVSSNAEIGRRVGVHRSTVGRIRARPSAALSDGEQEPVAVVAVSFPAPEIPNGARWPAVQFMKQTGRILDAGDACWLVDMGLCYEAEDRVDELMHAIRASAGADVQDPWAYLQRCVVNRGDVSSVSPQLLGDVLVWAGEDRLRYALTAISGGYVRRPRAYLCRMLQRAVAAGERAPRRPERPIAMAVAMVCQWAPELLVDGAAAAVEAEEAASRTGYVGRRPERETSLDCCIGVNGVTGDESNTPVIPVGESGVLESSPRTSKADATSVVPLGGTQSVPEPAPVIVLGPDALRATRSCVDALGRVPGVCGPLPEKSRLLAVEIGPCRHPLAGLLALGMDLEAVVPVECLVGCGHRLYSDRGPLVCPCHWSPPLAAQVARGLRQSRSTGLVGLEGP